MTIAGPRLKLALLTTDSRELLKAYGRAEPEFGTAPQALMHGLASLPEVEVHVVSCIRKTVEAPAKLAENIFFHSLHVRKFGWMRTGYQGCIRAVRHKLRKIQPDIVHGQGTELDCAMNAVFSGFPNVLTIHGNMAELARMFRARIGSFGWMAARLENYALKRTAGVFCNSAYTEDLVKPRARRVWRVPNAVRQEFFAATRQPCGSGRCVLLNVGLISPRKRQVELLDVARNLRQQGLDFELQFIGSARPDTPYGAAFLEKLKPMAAEGFACFVGIKMGDELIRSLDEAAAMVHFPAEESFGLVVAEALARELKFFGARLGGISEIVAGVPEAELFSADDWPGLTQAIAAWIRRGAHRAPGAAQAMRHRYHPEVIARRHLEIYREVLHSRSG